VNNRISVPDTILFRAGGDGSVRGYDYRTLGPSRNGASSAARSCSPAASSSSIRSAPSCRRCSAAVFVDAGNAADRWGEIRRCSATASACTTAARSDRCASTSPTAEDVHDWRVHITVGITF
jgi:translocation and assembly module TamA